MKMASEFKSKAYGIKSKALVKKGVTFALVGAFAVTGIVAAQLPQSVAMAATQQNFYHHDRGYRGDFSAETAAQDMQDTYGVDKQAVLDYNAKGWRFRDLERAAFISYTSGKPLSEVIGAKTVTNSWRDVSESFGITAEKDRASRQKLMSNRMASRLGMDAGEVNKALDEGYHPSDITMAAMLAKKADKSFKNVLNMKKINNSWYDVAASLNIDEQELYQIRTDARDCMDGYGHMGRGYRGDHRGGWHNGPRG